MSDLSIEVELSEPLKAEIAAAIGEMDLVNAKTVSMAIRGAIDIDVQDGAAIMNFDINEFRQRIGVPRKDN